MGYCDDNNGCKMLVNVVVLFCMNKFLNVVSQSGITFYFAGWFYKKIFL